MNRIALKTLFILPILVFAYALPVFAVVDMTGQTGRLVQCIDGCGIGDGNFGFFGNWGPAGLQGYEPPEPTFNNPTTPPPAPTCTLTADPSSIHTGDSSTLHWSMSNFTSFSLTNFSIIPPNTAQTVTVDCSSIGYQYQDCPLNVPIASVQSIEIVQQYSYCNKMAPNDCVPSLGVNYGITNGNHLWVDKGYRARFAVTYVPTGSVTPVSSGTGPGSGTASGDTLVTPPITTEYKINLVGPGGTAECKKTVTVTPPNTGCIRVLKETYDTAGAILTPVAQFSFKLDGGTTVHNDEFGNAVFTNVPAGTHTVTEVNPGPNWTVLQSTPQNGQVVVQAGQTCAAISFKNKQVVTEEPKGCELTIDKAVDSATAHPATIIKYTINFKNTGDRDCTGGGVKVVDVVDPGLTYIANSETHTSGVTAGYGSDPVYTSSDRTLRWNANTLNPGETGSVTWKAIVNTPTQCSVTIPNKAKITSYEYDNFGAWVYSNTVNVAVTKYCPSPTNGCIRVKKETYNTNNQRLTPTAQFTFKLDGSASTENDENGDALFSNVTPGMHTVTEIDGGPNWTQTSVSPTNGYVNVVSGPNCAVVTFKNKQVVTEEPKGCILTLKKEIIGDDHLEAGDRVHYKITIKNTGDRDCTGGGVMIKDTLDAGLTFYPLLSIHSSNINPGYESYPLYKSSDRTLRWNANVLNPDEEGFVEFRATVTTPTQCTATVPNKALASADQYDHFGRWEESNTVNVVVEKDCPPPTDVCPNIPGNQASVPEGKQLVGGQCLDIPVTPPGPTCTLSISKSSPINSGESIKVGWVSANATSGSIDNNAGNAAPVAGGSTDDLFPPSTTTYTGTFGNGVATTTCTASITVNTGGGGGGCNGSSCGGGGGGGGLNQPNVVLYGTPGAQPLAFVSLAAVPYTGFEAGALLTALFWFAVALWSAAIAYILMGRQGMRLIAERVFSFAPAIGYDEGAYAETLTDVAGAPLPDQTSVMASAMAMPLTPAIRVMPLAAPTAPVAKATSEGIPELSDVIETRAHAAGVLLSPEALTMAMTLAADRAECLRVFGDILNDAVKSVSREDGWILLSSDRFSDIAQKYATVVSTPAPAVAEPAFPTSGAQAVLDDSAAAKLAKAVVSGDRDAAFSLIRAAEQSNADPMPLMTGVATTLDRLYHARHDGTSVADLGLADAATGMSDEKLEAMVALFTHAVGNGYSSPFTGVKLALAQAFETK